MCRLLLTAAMLPASTVSAAPAIELRSGPERVNLVELYSSEGCSSCPPAEAWLTGLRPDPALWHRFVPIAFHVDYWDRLGWVDHYARAAFTDRQNRYAQAWGAGSIYTPGFVLNGQEWRPSAGALYDDSGATPGVLRAQMIGDRLTVTFAPHEQGQRHWIAHVALLGNGLETKVLAGENQGRRLHHDFVVLSLDDAVLKSAGQTYQTQIQLAHAVPAHPRSTSLAVWITEAGTTAVVQAAGADLP